MPDTFQSQPFGTSPCRAALGRPALGACVPAALAGWTVRRVVTLVVPDTFH